MNDLFSDLIAIILLITIFNVIVYFIKWLIPRSTIIDVIFLFAMITVNLDYFYFILDNIEYVDLLFMTILALYEIILTYYLFIYK